MTPCKTLGRYSVDESTAILLSGGKGIYCIQVLFSNNIKEKAIKSLFFYAEDKAHVGKQL